jgi:hypothetical protein
MPYIHARSIDFHDRNNWAIVWASLSPQNEAFIYREYNPSPLKNVTMTIAEEIGHMSGMTHFVMNLIDPLAGKIQTNTGISTIEDLNRIFFQLKHESVCTGGYWEPYDTKGLKGREEIRKRLQNSVRVGKPFNNRINEDGRIYDLPTLWISRECHEMAKSLNQWRYDEWATGNVIAVKDKKEIPSQKFSHFCTALEGIFKDNRFRPRKDVVFQENKAFRDRHYYFKQDRR